MEVRLRDAAGGQHSSRRFGATAFVCHLASRLAWLVFGLSAVAWVFGEHHTLAVGEFSLFEKFAGDALFTAGPLWLTYVAVEPFVRRRWPDDLVVWNRLLAGRVRDPLVGRDLLVGCVMGVAWALLNRLLTLLTPVQPNEGIFLRTLYLLSGLHHVVAGLSGLIGFCIVWCLAHLVLLFSLRALLRSTLAAAVANVIIVTAVFAIEEPHSLLIWSLDTAIVGSGVFTLVRYGLVAYVAQLIFANLLLGVPVSTQLFAWHSGIGLTGLGLLLAVALYAFHTSLGGQPVFGRATLEA